MSNRVADELRKAVADMPHGVWTQWHAMMVEAANEIDQLQGIVSALSRQCLTTAALPSPVGKGEA